jgi:CBS domain-containing protein
MARAAVDRPRPLGFFGGFAVERTGPHKDRLDLKASAVLPVTHAMRVYALSLGIRHTNTLDRLRAIEERDLLAGDEVRELQDAYRLVARLRLRHQLARLDAGLPADNFVRPRALSKTDRLLLKEAFKTIAWLERGVEERFQTALVGR